jgi:hypothetical protein
MTDSPQIIDDPRTGGGISHWSRRVFLLASLLAGSCTYPDTGVGPDGVWVVAESDTELAIEVGGIGLDSADGVTTTAFERAARETLDRGYTHFRVQRGRLTRQMRAGRGMQNRTTLWIELLRPPIPDTANVYDASVVLSQRGKVDRRWTPEKRV